MVSHNFSITTLLYLMFQAAGCVTELALRVANKDLKVCAVGEISKSTKILVSPFFFYIKIFINSIAVPCNNIYKGVLIHLL